MYSNQQLVAYILLSIIVIFTICGVFYIIIDKIIDCYKNSNQYRLFV